MLSWLNIVRAMFLNYYVSSCKQTRKEISHQIQLWLIVDKYHLNALICNDDTQLENHPGRP